ncbi:MAG: glycosyltransferase family 8 protein, partial [Planctomycetia bacterium]|nr:glycosyltransferase family 8 protein [Planctomycetia bacterium]
DGGISPRNKKRLQKTVGDQPLFFHTMDNSLFKDCPVAKDSSYSLAAYYRFIIPRLLPDAKRVLYLDCDIIVRDSLASLWNYDLKGACLGAVYDNCWEAFLPQVHRYHGEKEAERLGISDYINTGVLLIDAEKWRNDHVEEKLFAYVQAPQAPIKIVDQDVINPVLAGSIEYLSPQWNYMTSEEYGLSPEWVQKNATQAKIVHFTGGNKPWTVGSNHPLQSMYLHYLNLTPWRYLLWPHRRLAFRKNMVKAWISTKAALKTLRRCFIQYRWSADVKYLTLLGIPLYRKKKQKENIDNE